MVVDDVVPSRSILPEAIVNVPEVFPTIWNVWKSRVVFAFIARLPFTVVVVEGPSSIFVVLLEPVDTIRLPYVAVSDMV